MSRYRPPQKSGAKYITSEGEQQLKKELHQLWKIDRPQVTQSVSEAAALGDRSENAEYIYGKKRLREIDRRVRFLTKRLEEVTVITDPPSDLTKVYFGATVTLEDEKNNSHRYRLVGPDEINPQRGYISIDSPMGHALLGQQVGSEIKVTSLSGIKRYHVFKIDYPQYEIL